MNATRRAQAWLWVGSLVLIAGVARPGGARPPDTATIGQSPWLMEAPAETSGKSVQPPDLQQVPDCTLQTFTGADDCTAATVIDVPVGLVGAPSTVTVSGDNTPATFDCPELGTIWWEAFRIDRCANVTLDLCCTTPTAGPTFIILADQCPAGGTCTTGPFATDFSRGAPICSENNPWMIFRSLPAGTYYYPVYSNAALGPYQMHISAEACTGACCSGTGCVEGVTQEDCAGPGAEWFAGQACCEAECPPPPPGGYNSAGMTLRSHIPIASFPGSPHTANEAWGYVSPAGVPYAIIGFTTGTGFVRLSDPDSPVIVAVISGGGVDQPWRDMDTFGEYAYVVSDGDGVGLQIVDLSNIDSGIVTLANTTDLGIGLVQSHNVRVNRASGYLYLAIPDFGEGIPAFDLNADPVNPTFEGWWFDPFNAVRCHDLNVVTYDNPPNPPREVAFCFAESFGLYLVDVTDKSNMFTISELFYPNTTYSHQGWLTEDRRYVLLGDELDESFDPDVTETTTYVIDVADLTNPTFVTALTNGQCAIDHNLMVRDQCVYEANYSSGIRVYDISDINNGFETAYFDTHPENNVQDYTGTWGVYARFPAPYEDLVVAGDIERGLFVLDHACTAGFGPISRFSADPNPAACNQTITFDATASTHQNPARSIVQYEWDVDYDGMNFTTDASTATPTHSHSYNLFGLYRVALRVTDDNAPPLIHTTVSEVGVSVGNAGPSADSGGPYVMFSGADLTVNGSGSSDPNSGCGDTLSYAWDILADGSFEVATASSSALLTWSQLQAAGVTGPGTYDLALRVTDSFGLSDTEATLLEVLPASCPGVNECNGHGTCIGPDVCQCDSGFAAPDCSDCSAGRFGAACTECPGGAANPCNGNGVCDDGLGGLGTCACDPGWSGVDCGTPDVNPPLAATFPHDRRKNRYLSFAPNNTSTAVSFRVELTHQGCAVSKICCGGTSAGNDGAGCIGDGGCTGGAVCRPRTCVSPGDCKVCVAGPSPGRPCVVGSDCGGGTCEPSGEACSTLATPEVVGWVGDPVLQASGDFRAELVPSMPAPRAWPEAVVHVTGLLVAPSQSYAVRATPDGSTFSSSLALGTTPKPSGKFWADAVGSFLRVCSGEGVTPCTTATVGTDCPPGDRCGSWTPSNGLINVDDVVAWVKYVTLSTTAAHTSELDIGREVPSWLVNADDLQLILQGFANKTYPPAFFPPGSPDNCP